MRNILTLLCGILLCLKQITSLFIDPFYEVSPYEPQYRDVISTALSKLGLLIEDVELISLFEKAGQAGIFGTYKLTFKKGDGTCFISWRTLPIVGIRDLRAPSCVQRNRQYFGNASRDLTERMANMEMLLQDMSFKLDGIMKKLSKLGKLDGPQDNGEFSVENDWIAEYLQWKLKRQKDKNQKSASNKMTQKPKESRTTEMDQSKGKYTAHKTTHVPEATQKKVSHTTHMKTSETKHKDVSHTTKMGVSKTTPVIELTTTAAAGWFPRWG